MTSLDRVHNSYTANQNLLELINSSLLLLEKRGRNSFAYITYISWLQAKRDTVEREMTVQHLILALHEVPGFPII